MQALSRHEIISSFDDTEDLVLPNIDSVSWENLEYFGWVHPSGHLGFVVVQSPNDGSLRGVRLRRSERKARKAGLEMCSWCHHVHKANGTAMFTVTVRGSDDRHMLGNLVCKDLDCSLRIRNLVKPDTYMRETLYEPAKIWRMQQSMFRWLGRARQL